jgi:hypothetical protein
MSYQPDDGDTDDCRDEAHDPKAAVRHVEGCGHGAFGSEREGRDRMPSIAKNRPIAAKKSNIGANSSYWEPGAGGVGEAGGVAAGELAAPGGICPDGLEK